MHSRLNGNEVFYWQKPLLLNWVKKNEQSLVSFMIIPRLYQTCQLPILHIILK
ncbi:Uncharacterised protein [Salmonella enterica]|nr:Uncharacterised protein [Salmonella enterica]